MRSLKKGIEKLKNVILSKKILLNFYRELNVNFSLSLKINIDSLTFLNAINFYFKVFYKVSNVLFIFTVQIISFQSFSLFFIENIVKGQMHHHNDLGSKCAYTCHLSNKTTRKSVLLSTPQIWLMKVSKNLA